MVGTVLRRNLRADSRTRFRSMGAEGLSSGRTLRSTLTIFSRVRMYWFSSSSSQFRHVPPPRVEEHRRQLSVACAETRSHRRIIACLVGGGPEAVDPAEKRVILGGQPRLRESLCCDQVALTQRLVSRPIPPGGVSGLGGPLPRLLHGMPHERQVPVNPMDELGVW